jgi:hypothetical protein
MGMANGLGSNGLNFFPFYFYFFPGTRVLPDTGDTTSMANCLGSNDLESHPSSVLLVTLRPMVGLSRQNFFFGGNALFHVPPRQRRHPPTPATVPLPPPFPSTRMPRSL